MFCVLYFKILIAIIGLQKIVLFKYEQINESFHI